MLFCDRQCHLVSTYTGAQSRSNHALTFYPTDYNIVLLTIMCASFAEKQRSCRCQQEYTIEDLVSNTWNTCLVYYIIIFVVKINNWHSKHVTFCTHSTQIVLLCTFGLAMMIRDEKLAGHYTANFSSTIIITSSHYSQLSTSN